MNDAAVAGGLGWLGGGEGHGSVLGQVEGDECGEGLGGDEGGVAGEDEEVLVACDRVFCALDSMTGAALLGLVDEVDAGCSNGGFDLVGLVTDDGEDAGGRDDLGCGGDDMSEQGFAADFMQDFGAAGFEAGSLAGGHDYYGEIVVCSQFATPSEYGLSTETNQGEMNSIAASPDFFRTKKLLANSSPALVGSVSTSHSIAD